MGRLQPPVFPISQATTGDLDELAPDDYQPDLNMLDAQVTSLEVESAFSGDGGSGMP